MDGLAPSLCGMSSPPKAIGARRAARTAAAQQSGGTGTVSGVGDEAPGALFLQGKELEAKGELKAALDKYTRAAEVKASELKLGKTALLAQNAARQVCNGCHCHVPYVTAAVATFPCDGCCSPRAAT